MREYIIKGEKSKKEWGKLYYSDEKNTFRILFCEGIDIKKDKPPAYVHRFMPNGRRELKGEQALLWVTSRIIPKNRQNIAGILKAAGMKVYREIDMLELHMGRSTYDDLYLERVK